MVFHQQSILFADDFNGQQLVVNLVLFVSLWVSCTVGQLQLSSDAAKCHFKVDQLSTLVVEFFVVVFVLFLCMRRVNSVQ